MNEDSVITLSAKEYSNVKNKSKALDIIKKKHINVGAFQLKVGKEKYKFNTYIKFWNAWGYSPFESGDEIYEKRLNKQEWNTLCEELL